MNREKKKIINKITIHINDQFGFNLELKGFNNVKKFVENELINWESININDADINNLIANYEAILTEIISLEESVEGFSFENIEDEVGVLESFYYEKQNIANNPLLVSTSALGRLIIDLYKENQPQGQGAFSYLKRRNVNTNDINTFIGLQKCISLLNESNRHNIEEGSFEELYNKFSQVTHDSIEELDKQKNEFAEASEKRAENFDIQKTTYANWYEKKQHEFEQQLKKGEEELLNVRNTYTKHMALEGPVDYWTERTEKYKKLGITWASLLSITILFIIIILFSVLYNLPDAFHHKILNGDPEAVRGIIVFAAILSFAAYLAKTFSRLTFSSFHLQRDSEEREQLTMVYLALVKDGKINDKDLSLVIQSLFARSDSGLLHGDSSPVMPNVFSMANNLFKK